MRSFSTWTGPFILGLVLLSAGPVLAQRARPMPRPAPRPPAPATPAQAPVSTTTRPAIQPGVDPNDTDMTFRADVTKLRMLAPRYAPAEALAQQLLQKYPAPEYQGRIHIAMMDVYRSNTDRPKYDLMLQQAQKALEYPLDPLSKQNAYLACAVSVKLLDPNHLDGENWPAVRKESLGWVLKALKELLPYHLAETRQPLPTVEAWMSGEWPEGSPQYQQGKKKYEDQVKALKDTQLKNKLMGSRKTAENEIVDLYGAHRPLALEELETEAKAALQDDATVARIMGLVKAYIEQYPGLTAPLPGGPAPAPRADQATPAVGLQPTTQPALAPPRRAMFHVVLSAKNTGFEITINGITIGKAYFDQQGQQRVYSIGHLLRQGDNTFVIKWSRPDRRADAPAPEFSLVVNESVEAPPAARSATLRFQTSPRLEWKPQSAAGGVATSGQETVTVTVNGPWFKALPWDENRDRKFEDADRAAILALVKEVADAIEKRDLAATERLDDEYRARLVALPGSSEANARDRWRADVAPWFQSPYFKPVPYDEKNVLVEKVEGYNLVHVHAAAAGSPHYGYVILVMKGSNPAAAGFTDFWLSFDGGKWVVVHRTPTSAP